MRGDVSYERLPACNQKKVLELIREPLQYNDARTWKKPGFVYVVRDPELKLVKIGFTTDRVSDRISRIGSQCRASSKRWQIEHEDQNIPILAYRRLERLVHMDLAPHRWFFLCECGLAKRNANGPTEHQEWFDVSPEIAIKTIKLWRSFLLQDPYGPPLRDTKMQLKERWIHRVDKCKGMDCNEKHKDHETRLDRWRKLLHLKNPDEPTRVSKQEETEASITKIKYEPVEEGPHEPTRVPKQEETDAPITKIKSEPVERDMATISVNVPQKAPEDLPIPSTEPSTVAEPPELARDISADLVDGAQTPKSHGNAAPSQITPSSGEAAPSVSASAAASEDQTKAETQYEDSKRDHMSKENLSATLRGVIHGEEFLITLTAVLNHKRPAIPERTIMDDLTALRWPLGCAVAFALHTPYVPPLLSAMLWTVFLPFLVAELRGWML
ncbi:hypothetical protein KC363_g1242 [Hortaea werneckii]|nr:hypothetical protein KC361_g2848 [Hortaea werneckii]KAI6881444.1 hypothetical protein KC325_g6516 [Hortaea werneckii]KAI6989537.1 hypothetical protein KC359_g7160 [Hortaea werneckii]KAI7143084.1 hypothetical protein KC344_g6624 [Hortaea werneckii]KAI7170868.1 hypothetical protein KC360_g6512 [Hortaea werneckii]